MAERKQSLLIIQTASNACGLAAFQASFQRHRAEQLGSGLSTLVGVHAAMREYVAPIKSRLIREKIGLVEGEERLLETRMTLAALMRDVSIDFYAFGLLFYTAAVTDNFTLGLASFLSSKFLLNSLVHFEMFKYYKR